MNFLTILYKKGQTVKTLLFVLLEKITNINYLSRFRIF